MFFISENEHKLDLNLKYSLILILEKRWWNSNLFRQTKKLPSAAKLTGMNPGSKKIAAFNGFTSAEANFYFAPPICGALLAIVR